MNKDLFFLSRRGLGGGGPTSLPVMPEIVKDVEAWNLADQSAVVSEWMARRTMGECPELLYIHDFYWLADKWVGNQILKDRRVLLDKLLLSEKIKRPECVYQGFVDFFNKQKEIPYTEGCVIKSLNATVIGDRKESKKNPLFTKIKWRDGADGRTEFKY